MSLDGCLPAFLLTKNKWRGTTHWIILCYLALATSQVLLLEGDVDALAGVYSFAFLGVMGIFSLGALGGCVCVCLCVADSCIHTYTHVYIQAA